MEKRVIISPYLDPMERTHQRSAQENPFEEHIGFEYQEAHPLDRAKAEGAWGGKLKRPGVRMQLPRVQGDVFVTPMAGLEISKATSTGVQAKNIVEPATKVASGPGTRNRKRN